MFPIFLYLEEMFNLKLGPTTRSSTPPKRAPPPPVGGSGDGPEIQ